MQTPLNASAPAVLVLDHHDLHLLQYMVTNILIESYGTGSIHLMNDDILCCRVEYHLGWYLNLLDSPYACVVVARTRFSIMSYFQAVATSVTIHYAILGLALEHICLFLNL
ncbi:hypothetical protein BDN71DRAFT_1509111 [Pleurotus eryngii]|uniref:Uncharacterized protein n=1 Tax=Pleurotus eryngii TaxID=5323 RepID=A0A9P5ZRE6_PLEER|nr:hypothetical protein BDN71DRAFT_1509111 [Pleurotus eryngii]